MIRLTITLGAPDYWSNQVINLIDRYQIKATRSFTQRRIYWEVGRTGPHENCMNSPCRLNLRWISQDCVFSLPTADQHVPLCKQICQYLAMAMSNVGGTLSAGLAVAVVVTAKKKCKTCPFDKQ